MVIVIVDFIILFFNDWEDGYCDLGDYDLWNNFGNLVVLNFFKNGFFFNNFVISFDWVDVNGWLNINYMNFYLVNGVIFI